MNCSAYSAAAVWFAIAANIGVAFELPTAIRTVVMSRCMECHDAGTKKGGLDLELLLSRRPDAAVIDMWVQIYDRVRDGEMPPKDKLSENERSAFLKSLQKTLVTADLARRGDNGRATLRRLNRTEYENTLRDLLNLPELEVRDLLPEDGRVQGYDKGGPTLEFSTVQINKYLQAADKALATAVMPYPERDEVRTARLYGGDDGGIMDGIINGCGICLKDFKYDQDLFPLAVPSGNVPGGSGYGYFDQLKSAGKIPYRGSIGFMRNGDDYKPDFGMMSPVVPGYYRIQASLWSFRWDKGDVKPTTPQIGRIQVNGQYSKSTGAVVGYFDAPSLKPKVSEAKVWLTPGDSLQFQPLSILHDWQGIPYGKMNSYVGDGIAVDWVEVEGPLVDAWPEVGHQRLFGDLPLERCTEQEVAKRPARRPIGQWRGGPQPFTLLPKHHELWTVASTEPTTDAEKLLAKFLPLAFRRPVEAEDVRAYVSLVMDRLEAKATFEEAMLTAYRAALCSPEFLLLREPVGKLDNYALASRLSYFLWSSLPDEELLRLAAEKKLSDLNILHAQTERMLADPKAERFIVDFTNQWLNLRLIDDNTPHSKLYPEFSPLLRDSMVGETRAFFRELLKQDLPAANIVDSDFAMLNQPLAAFYGDFDLEDFTIPQEKPRPKQPRETLPRPVTSAEPIVGFELRKISLPADSQRGGFLTQAAILKVTANGTTTSPVRRGAWVQRKIVGQPPKPPPPNIPAIEPDTRGLTTLREILAKHRADVSCAGCHRKIDPPGFALENYDAIGGFRPRFRALENGDRVTKPPAGAGRHEFLLGLPVDASGELADGRHFADIREFKRLLLADEPQIARNFAEQLVVYATGTPISFADREAIDAIINDTLRTRHGVRSILHAVIQSQLFLNK